MLGSKKPSGIPWQACIAWIGPNKIDKSLATQAGTPDKVLSILKDAFGKMSKDPQFDDMMKKLISDVYDVNIGDETDLLMKQVLEAPPEATEYARGLQKNFDIISK